MLPNHRNLSDLFSHLTGCLGLQVEAAEISAAGESAFDLSQHQSADSRLHVVLEAGRRIGLEGRVLSASIADAMVMAGPSACLVLSLPDRADVEWVVVERSGRHSALTAIPQRQPAYPVSVADLTAWTGTAQEHALTWLVLHAAAPLERARSPHDAEFTPLRRMQEILRPEWREIRLSLLFALGVGFLSLATPVAVQALVNTVALGGLLQPLLVLSILLFAFLSFSGALSVLQTYVVEIIQRRVFVRVLTDLGYRLPRLRTEVLDQNHGSELVNRFFDVMTVQKVSAVLLLDGVAIAMQTVIGLLVLAFYHPLLLAFDIVLVGAIVFVLFVLGQGAEATAIYESKCKYKAVAWLEEIARNPLTFKAPGGNDLAVARADDRAMDYLHARTAHFRVVLRQTVGSVALQAIAGTALLTVGGDLVITGQLTLGQLVAAELIVSSVLASFTKMGKHLESFYDLLAAVDKLGHVIDLPLESGVGVSTPATPATPATLRLHDVGFSYGHRAPVFNDLSFTVAAGERLGIVGGHGSGKSTLAQLLYCLRSPERGLIELNGINVRDLHLDSLRRYIAVVKDVEVIEDTIAANIRMGRSDVDETAIRDVLRRVALWDDITAFADGTNTELGHAGAPLSVGQTRRLMLARALAGNPLLLVVDGLLDDMDTEVRDVVCDSIFAADAPWTLLVLSLHADGYMRRCGRLLEFTTNRRLISRQPPGSDST